MLFVVHSVADSVQLQRQVLPHVLLPNVCADVSGLGCSMDIFSVAFCSPVFSPMPEMQNEVGLVTDLHT